MTNQSDALDPNEPETNKQQQQQQKTHTNDLLFFP